MSYYRKPLRMIAGGNPHCRSSEDEARLVDQTVATIMQTPGIADSLERVALGGSRTAMIRALDDLMASVARRLFADRIAFELRRTYRPFQAYRRGRR